MGYNSGTEGQEEAWRQADQRFYKSKGGGWTTQINTFKPV